MHINRLTRRLIILLGLCSVLAAAWVLPSLASQDPTAIELDYFEGYWVDDAVEIEWGTGSETNTAGFEIWRVERETMPANKDDGFEQIVVEVDGELYGPGFAPIIPAALNGVAGADYLAFDDDIEEDTTYWYILGEIEADGGTVYYDQPEWMLQVNTFDGAPTATPSGIGGGNGSPTPTQTPTNAPTQTPTPTATTNSGGGGVTPTVTATTASTGGGTNPTATSPPAATPTATVANNGSGNSGGGGQPTATLENSSSPGGADDGGQPIAQITATADPNAYPGNGNEGILETDDQPYPDGQEPTATAYPVGEVPAGGDNNIGNDSGVGQQNQNSNDFLGNESNGNGFNGDSAEFLNLQEGETQSRERLLLWVGFIAALLVFAGGMFGSIVLFTRRRA